ncbi:MAG: hypothetical protein NQ127_02225 [Candidatus Cardinium sp.]|nr:hypothetical protein [Candidatus Cardinium sp.]
MGEMIEEEAKIILQGEKEGKEAIIEINKAKLLEDLKSIKIEEGKAKKAGETFIQAVIARTVAAIRPIEDSETEGIIKIAENAFREIIAEHLNNVIIKRKKGVKKGKEALSVTVDSAREESIQTTIRKKLWGDINNYLYMKSPSKAL